MTEPAWANQVALWPQALPLQQRRKYKGLSNKLERNAAVFNRRLRYSNSMNFRHLPSYFLLSFSTVCVFALAYYGASFNPPLQYQRSAIDDWQWWRLLTAHLVHLNLNHALLNVLGLWLLAFCLGQQRRPLHWLLAAVFIGLIIAGAIYVWQTNIRYYLGLSGVLHGLVVFGLLPLCQKGRAVGWIGLLLLTVKLYYEQVTPGSHSATEALIAAPVVSIAHLYGALGGALLGVLEVVAKAIKRRLNGA